MKIAIKSSRKVKFPDFRKRLHSKCSLMNMSENADSWRRGSRHRKLEASEDWEFGQDMASFGTALSVFKVNTFGLKKKKDKKGT